ncbi:MAG: hypothetical protein ABII89_01800 [Candidatus Omnitrophota bacterium]
MYTRQERLEKKIHECLDGLTAGNSLVIEWIRKALKESHRDETEYNRSCLEELNRRYETLQRREDALYDDKVDGKISEELYGRKFKQYSGEREEVLDSIRRHETGREKYFELGMNILELAQRAREIYISRSVEEKRQLLKLVFSNLVLKDGNLCPDWHPAFRLIAEKAKTDEQRRGWDSAVSTSLRFN